MNINDWAKEISHKYHHGQFRRDKITPYTVHTDYVGNNAHKFYKGSLPPNDIGMYIDAVGYLHDVLEDTELTVNELLSLGIQAGFDSAILADRIISPVVRLTRPSKEMAIRPYLRNIKGCYVATAVKLADLEHNMSDLGFGNQRDKYELCKNFLEN